MEYICKDNGESEWFFDEEKNTFFRLQNGKQIGKISASHLPDPEYLWMKRCEAYGKSLHTDIAKTIGNTKLETPIRLKPTDAVFAMWERIHAH